MRIILISAVALAAAFPTWSLARGNGGGGGGMGHGADVSQAAHAAKLNGTPVGTSVRGVARSNSQGPAHASTNAISHVQNSPGKAASNSVLGGTSTTTMTTSHAAKPSTRTKTKPAH
jgi:hypothetical protein